MNVIYGPEGFSSIPGGQSGVQATLGTSFIEENERMPSVGKRNQNDAGEEGKIHSRMDQLGY